MPRTEFSPEEAAAKRAAAAAKFWSTSPPVVHVKPLTPHQRAVMAAHHAIDSQMYAPLRRKTDEHARQVRSDAIYTSSIAVELATRSMIAARSM